MMPPHGRDGAPELETAVRGIVEQLRAGAADQARDGLRELLHAHGPDAVRAVRARANGLVMNEGAWSLVQPIYADLAEVDPKSRRLLARANWVSRRAAAFERFFESPTHEARVLRLVSGQFPAAAAVRREPAKGGLNTACSFRHHVLDSSGETCLVLFEKIYIGHLPIGCRKVRALHARVGRAPRFAPAYHGALRAGPFVSTLHEAVDGPSPSPRAWPVVAGTLLGELWTSQDSARGSDAGPALTGLRNAAAQWTGIGHASGTTWRWTARAVRELPALLAGEQMRLRLSEHIGPERIDRLTHAQGRIATRLAALPHFVMHGDMHRTQALHDTRRDRYVLIDWDRWSLEPLGAGWPVAATDTAATERPEVPPALAEIAERHGVAPADAMLAATMWALGRAARHGERATARRLSGWVLALLGR